MATNVNVSIGSKVWFNIADQQAVTATTIKGEIVGKSIVNGVESSVFLFGGSAVTVPNTQVYTSETEALTARAELLK